MFKMLQNVIKKNKIMLQALCGKMKINPNYLFKCIWHRLYNIDITQHL